MATGDEGLNQSRWLLKANGIEGYFDTKSGGGVEMTRTRYKHGGSRDPWLLPADKTFSDLVLGRAIVPRRDIPIIKFLSAGIEVSPVTPISVTAIGPDYVADPATTLQWFGKLSGVTPNEVDANSDAASLMTITFQIVRMA